MPSSPPANPTQKALLETLTDLAATDAVNASNQITYLNQKLDEFENGKVLFQDRYAYWSGFVDPYETERQFLDGNAVGAPVTMTDYNNFLGQTGRLWNGALPAPDRFVPVRITQFDGGGLVYTAANDELPHMNEEANRRADLLTGISSPSFPTGFTLVGTLSPGATSMTISRSTAGTIPTGVRIAVVGSSSSCLVLVTGSAAIPPISPAPPPYTYSLNIVIETATFAAIGAGASILNAIVFNNAERTSKTAAAPARQPILNGMISTYQTAITNWRNNLQSQRTAILAQTAEDAPDSTYITNQQAMLTNLTNYLVTTDVSNTGLANTASYNSTRTAARTARVSWITNRLISSTAYDSRYKYADRLYNLADGSFTSIKILTKQRDDLVIQQAASNARAAKLSGEIF